MGQLLATFGLGNGNSNSVGATQPPMTTPPIVPQSGDPNPVTPQGDNWQPRKPTLLGALADAFLMSKGMKPAYQMQRDAANVQDALSGYVSDPETAIKRLSKIRGHEADAMQLYNQYVDNKRADDAAADLQEERQYKRRAYLGSYFGAISRSKNPEANYKRMLPQLQKMAEAAGVDALPSEWDPDTADFYALGGLTPDQQHDNDSQDDYRERRLSQMEQTIQDRADYQDERLRQSEDRQAEAERHNRAMENKGTGGRNTAYQADHIVKTKYGPGKVYNKGANLSIKAGTDKDGNPRYAIYQTAGPNKWNFVGYETGKKK